MSEDRQLNSSKSFSHSNAFNVGWELANWTDGPHCPTSNMVLSEFSARLKLDWPPQAKEMARYAQRVREILRESDIQSGNWFDIGLLGCRILLEMRSVKRRYKKFTKQSAPKRIFDLQTRFTKVLVQLNITPEEKHLIVRATQQLLTGSEEEYVEKLFSVAYGRFRKKQVTNRPVSLEADVRVAAEDLKGKVDFAILTVREDENKAVLSRFPKRSIYQGNHRSYSIGRVSLKEDGHYLVAIVRSIEQGEGHGQDVARDVIEDLNPQWLLLVGIAGGVPAAEFSLGDVVAASRLTDFSVRAALEGKSAQFAVGGGPMHKQVQNHLALIPAMSDELGEWNSRASIGMDKPPVRLVKDNFYGDDDWQKKVKDFMTRHYGRSAPPRPPLVTTGAIVTSDTLVKDSQTLKQWQESARQVLAVEMELGGVYIAARRAHHEYPILAIRGISDIVGFKRHPDWTEYACQSAAAFAHAFILTRPISPRSIDKGTDIS